jgi:hypothetical protein
MFASHKHPTARLAVAALLGIALNATVALPGWGGEAGPTVTLQETKRDFGSVARGTKVIERFAIGNQGSAPLELQGLEFSTPGMRARVHAVIEPGETADLEITWDTSRYTRDVEGQAVLLLNDPVRPQVAFTLTGFVVSPIEVDPVPAFYISQFQGESATQSVTIRNNQDHDIQITGSERRGEHFTIDHTVLEPGRSFTVTASATPDTPPGRYREAVMIFTDDPERPKISLGVNILVKQDLHSSTDAIDMGRVRLASLRANPDLLTH